MDDAKIAAVGVSVSRWHTMHGVSINVCPIMADYDRIVPCGLVGKRVTSLAQLAPQLFADTPHADVVETVRSTFCKHFETVFDVALAPADLPPLQSFMNTLDS